MSRGTEDSAVRYLTVTPGNLRQKHLYVRGIYDFLPADCIGPARGKRNSGAGAPIEIELDGLNETVSTDIGTSAASGEPRGFFRGRTWVGRFFEHHQVTAGEQVALTRLHGRRYRLSVSRSTTGQGGRRRAAEFFDAIEYSF